MSRAKSLCTALLAVFVTTAAMTAATDPVLALPDVRLLPGETYPVTSTGKVTGKVEGEVVSKLESELGEKLTATGLSVSFELLELSSSGPGELVFTGVLEPKGKTSCKTAGSAAGTVVVPREYHVVNTSTASAFLILFKELIVECNSGKLKVKIRSPGLAKLEKVTSGADLTKYGLVAKCSGKGKQELKEYLNDEGKGVKAGLTANFGLGFETACESVEEEAIMTSTKMIVFENAGSPGPEPTTLSTKLSGESKEAEELTVLEGAKVKDKATLGGKNASEATGKVTYKVYSDKECKTLATAAGEVTVSGESVPASSEEELEGGKTYYWQAHYSGDAKNAESTSSCAEILNVKAKASLSTKLSGEGKEAEELTVLEGAKVKDKATLSGTNSSTAGGEALYKVYSDSECKTLVKEAGEVTVSSGSVPASSEEELEGGERYYWQATYAGDTLHQESKSACGAEILNVEETAEEISEEKGGLEGEEGKGSEEEKRPGLSITPLVWSGGGGCPKTLLGLGKVKFSAIGQWCEYRVDNTSETEKLILIPGQKYKPACEYNGGAELCLEFIAVALGNVECQKNMVLPAGIGKECFVRLRYEKKPKAPLPGEKLEMAFFAQAVFPESGAVVKREVREKLK